MIKWLKKLFRKRCYDNCAACIHMYCKYENGKTILGCRKGFWQEMKKDKDFEFYQKRSEAFEAEVKNLLKITIPKIDTPTADYLAKRIDLKRMEYERVLVDRFIGLVDERNERK